MRFIRECSLLLSENEKKAGVSTKSGYLGHAGEKGDTSPLYLRL